MGQRGAGRSQMQQGGWQNELMSVLGPYLQQWNGWMGGYNPWMGPMRANPEFTAGPMWGTNKAVIPYATPNTAFQSSPYSIFPQFMPNTTFASGLDQGLGPGTFQNYIANNAAQAKSQMVDPRSNAATAAQPGLIGQQLSSGTITPMAAMQAMQGLGFTTADAQAFLNQFYAQSPWFKQQQQAQAAAVQQTPANVTGTGGAGGVGPGPGAGPGAGGVGVAGGAGGVGAAGP